MKLLVVVPALGSVYGGPSKSVVELAQSLGKTGISVDLITTNANGQTVVDVPLQQWIVKDYYRVQYFPYLGIGDYKLSTSITRWMIKNASSYDLVQTNAIFSVPNLSAYFACWLRSVPYVVIPRGMLEPWALSYKAWKKKIYYALLERPALQRADALQMLASTEAAQIEPLHIRSPLLISPNGVCRQDFETLPDSDIFYEVFPETKNKTIILFLGRIDPKKGLDLLAQSFGKVHEQFPSAHLVIAGPDSVGFLSTVQRHLADNNCADAVTFTGMLSGELKYSALSAANYYVAPSYSEGFSMSVLEGMAAGLPCVITTGCNFPEAAQANVAHVVEANVDALTTALMECLSDPTAAKVMGESARCFIFNYYTWDKIGINLSEAYHSLLTKQPTPQIA